MFKAVKGSGRGPEELLDPKAGFRIRFDLFAPGDHLDVKLDVRGPPPEAVLDEYHSFYDYQFEREAMTSLVLFFRSPTLGLT